MHRFSLNELIAFDAVVTEGGYQAAARRLSRTHPTIHAAVRNLEQQLDVALFDRSAYRVKLTDNGKAFHARVTLFLAEARALDEFSEQLRTGQETDLTIVIGDACAEQDVLPFLLPNIDNFPHTKFHFYHESITGPWNKLLSRQADLIFHHIDKTNTDYEYIDLYSVDFIPVVAPNYLPFPTNASITPSQMLDMCQCIIRDSSSVGRSVDYFVLSGGRRCSVDTQELKKKLILSKLAWGRLPEFLIVEQLRDGSLLSIEGEHFKRNTAEIVLARLRDRTHGPVLQHIFQSAKNYDWA